MWFVTLIVGMILGGLLSETSNEDCPKRVLGYNCSGDRCDHRKSVLYTNMARMAKGAEEDAAKKEREKMLADQKKAAE